MQSDTLKTIPARGTSHATATRAETPGASGQYREKSPPPSLQAGVSLQQQQEYYMISFFEVLFLLTGVFLKKSKFGKVIKFNEVFSYF